MNNVFQACKLSCGLENFRGEFSGIEGALVRPALKSAPWVSREGWGEMKFHCCTFISFQTIATIDASLSRSHSLSSVTDKVIHTVKDTAVKLWFLTSHLAISSRMNPTCNYCTAVFIFFHLHTRFPHWTPHIFTRLLKFLPCLLLLNAASTCSLPPLEVNASQQTISHGWNKRGEEMEGGREAGKR